MRLDRNYSGSLCLSHYYHSVGIDPEILERFFDVQQRLVPTCFSYGLAAILSDIGISVMAEQQLTHVLSDIVDSGPFVLSTLSDELQAADDLNIQALQLNKLDGAVPFNSHGFEK